MNDRTRDNLLNIVKKNVYTLNNVNNDDFKTRIYSDFFASWYQEADFRRLGYFLHKVNHSVWFGQGLFHTNTMEGLWSQIKRLSNDFSGINFNVLEYLMKEGIEPKDYIYSCICYPLFFRECQMKNYTENQKRNYFNEILSK